MYNAARAKALEATIGFRFADDSFVATAGDDELKVTRGDTAGADATFVGDPTALAGAVYGKAPLDQLAAAGVLKVEGDTKAAERFISIFELPPKAGG
jgi:alkyl sulfatase BDS1-like metallo-beta-lactamase superfamily hydrolase